MFNWIKNKINKQVAKEHKLICAQNRLFYHVVSEMLKDDSYADIAIGGKEGLEELRTFLNEREERVIEIRRKGNPPYTSEDGSTLLDINREYMTIYMDNTYGIFPFSELRSFPDEFTPARYKLNLDDDEDE